MSHSASFAPMIDFKQTIQEAFPEAGCGFLPFGSRVVVQMRMPKNVTTGDILLPDEVRDTIKWNTQVGKVVAMGPLAFKSRSDLKEWPEGAWCQVGDYVRTPKYGGDKFEKKLDNGEVVLFAIFDDLNLLGRVEGDPRDMVAFV